MPEEDRSKYWLFTLNNYTEEELVYFRSLVDTKDEVTYTLFGLEVAPQTGCPHLQGYLELQNRQRLSQVRRLAPRCHLEKRRGSQSQAVEYCKKDRIYEEYGSLSGGQGHRSDLVALKNAIDSGLPMVTVADTHFSTYLRYYKGINEYKRLRATPRNWQTLNIVYWGRTGTGKTRSVHENATSLYVHPGGQWFDGYDGHKQVLFDDFGGSEFKLSYLLKLLDRYPMSVPIKGGFVNWCPEEIYITSNLDPDTWYANANPEHVLALKRRFSFVYHFE